MIVQRVRQAAKAQHLDLIALDIVSLTEKERDALIDSRRLSPDMVTLGFPEQIALVDRAGMISLLIHEEDHLRLQVILPGNDLFSAVAKAQEIEKKLSERLIFAFDPLRWGYLTTGLNNMGTGLRISAQLHLPALAILGRLSSVLDAAYTLNGAVRGPAGEHSRIGAGDLVQISNGVSAGRTVDLLTASVSGVVFHLVQAEREARVSLAQSVPDTIHKTAQRYWEELTKTEELPTETALKYLSLFRLAHLIGLAQGPDNATFAQLVALLDIQQDQTDDQRNRLRIRLSRLRHALRPYWT